MDITRVLISEKTINQIRATIFVDSILVDQHFSIIIISQNVLEYLGFSSEDVLFRNINYLSGSEDLAGPLQKELTAGFFKGLKAKLYTRSKECINVTLSGFYSGIISPVNEYIVLKIENPETLESVNTLLQQKSAELDNFIYRTAHDLRGPLATIKGLVNLIKIRKDETELERIISMLDAHTQKMDERLFQLVYLTQSDKEMDAPQKVVHFSVMETRLRKIIEKNAFVDFLELHFAAPPQKVQGLNEELLYGLSENLILYILSLSMNGAQCQISINILIQNNHLKLTIWSIGFHINNTIQEAISGQDFTYSNLIQYPQMINLYTAQKQAGQLQAKLTTTVISKESQSIEVHIPLP